MYNFYIAHTCNMAFDLFPVWLGEDEPMTADEFVKMFRDWYYQVSRVNCGLLERETRKCENFIPCSPEEPTRRKRSREKRAKTSDTE